MVLAPGRVFFLKRSELFSWSWHLGEYSYLREVSSFLWSWHLGEYSYSREVSAYYGPGTCQSVLKRRKLFSNYSKFTQEK
jgi:hypothetical protein